MNSHYGRKPTWDTIYDDEDDAPPLQKWLRATRMSLNQRLQNSKRDGRAFFQNFRERPRETSKLSAIWIARRVLNTAGILILIWIYVLYQSEETTFDDHIEKCAWSNWEHWPQQASPHRLILVTDPQLVDPHTYPGRPWPLSTLTVKHSDNYMRRSYSRIQRDLFPDTIMFMGDLFDGGREWSTATSQSVDDRWHGYGEAFWQEEYTRFSKIFFRDWRAALDAEETRGKSDPHIRVIASLPGNHDLGFGSQIQLPVRDRFNAFFGDSNRMDVIGNHTFVSVDTVSLSAMDDVSGNADIWRPAHEFLYNAKATRANTIEKHLRHVDQDLPRHRKHYHSVQDIDRRVADADPAQLHGSEFPDVPTILLTHVPLMRPPGKPCGSLRERHPPTPPPAGQKGPLDPDPQNALPSEGYGWQYKNALSSRISGFITDSLNGTISHAFSGDDHDFCEVVHPDYSSYGAGIKEITVKSISWTMGVRKPGFLLVSLWNEIDNDGKRIDWKSRQAHDTVQTHLCLLPDQISILIGYGLLLGASLFTLGLQATYKLYRIQNTQPGQRDEDSKSLLPTSASSAMQEKMNGSYRDSLRPYAHSQASSSSSDDAPSANLSARSASAMRPRSVSPLPSYGYGAQPPPPQPLVSYATNRAGWETSDSSHDLGWGAMRSRSERKPRPIVKRSLPAQFGILFAQEIWHVARVVLVWYWYLLYH